MKNMFDLSVKLCMTYRSLGTLTSKVLEHVVLKSSKSIDPDASSFAITEKGMGLLVDFFSK